MKMAEKVGWTALRNTLIASNCGRDVIRVVAFPARVGSRQLSQLPAASQLVRSHQEAGRPLGRTEPRSRSLLYSLRYPAARRIAEPSQATC